MGFVTTTLPATVVAARGSVVSVHVESVLTALAVGSVHIHLHVATGEAAVRTAGRVSTSEHVAVVGVALAGRLGHTYGTSY